MKQILVNWGREKVIANISKAKRSYTKYQEFRQVEKNIIEYASFSGHYRFYTDSGRVTLDTGVEIRECQSIKFQIGTNLEF